MEYLTNIATSIFVGIGSSLIFTYGNVTEKPKTLTPKTEVETSQSQKGPDYLLVSQSPPKYLKVNVNISHAEDLKIKEGDLIEAGQIITESAREQTRLIRGIDRINLLIKQTEHQQIISEPLHFSQNIAPLPPHNLYPEEVTVDNASLQLDIAKRKYQVEVNKELYLEEFAAVEKAEAKVQQLQDAVQSQQTMIDELALDIDQDIFPEVKNIIINKNQILNKKIAELEQAKIDLNWQEAKLKNAQQARKDRLINIVYQIEQSHGNLALARAKLEAAKAEREYLEYQHNLASLRRIEQENQIRQSDLQKQQKNKELKLTQLREQLAQLEAQLASLSVVKSPYSGKIQSIKANKLQNNTFNVEIIFMPNPGDEFLTQSTVSARSPLAAGKARSPSAGIARLSIPPVGMKVERQKVTQRPVFREEFEEQRFTIPEFNKYIWQEMLGDLPCGEATRECIKILQDKAILNIENSTNLRKIKEGIRDAESKIYDAEFGANAFEDNNRQSLSLESFMPIIQYYLATDEPFSEVDSQGTDEEKPPGPLERILSDILNPLNFVNNILIEGGISLISGLFSSGNNSQKLGDTQGRQVSISDLKIKLFALEQDVAEIEQAIRNETRSMVTELNTKLSDFQIAREIAYRYTQRLEAFTIIYRFGGESTQTYLTQLSELDQQKAETLRAWYAMENQLELLKLLVLGEVRGDAISHE